MVHPHCDEDPVIGDDDVFDPAVSFGAEAKSVTRHRYQSDQRCGFFRPNVPATAAVHIPDTLSFEEAATLLPVQA